MAKILMVDDAGFVRRWCGRVLGDRGYEVVEAADGAEAVRLYDRERPDAVVMDVRMPGMDGIQALAAIRRADPNARVVMLSSVTEFDVVLEARKHGARDYVVKPCEPAGFVERLERALA